MFHFTEYYHHSRMVRMLYDQYLEPICEAYQLTHMELEILLFLVNNPELDTATDIIESKKLTKSHVSSSLKLLEQKGFISKNYHEDNKKTVHLSVLPEASEIVEKGREAQRLLLEAMFGDFTKEELQMLTVLNEKLYQKISQLVRR